jgi:hypothetical protein
MHHRLYAVLALLIACGQSDNQRSDQGRGDAACHDWQDAVCDYNDKCHGSLSRAQCDAQQQSFTCKSDAIASSCANAYRDLSCDGVLAASCSLDQVADPFPAQEACDMLVEMFCGAYASCGKTDSEQTCVMIASTQAFKCNQAIGYGLAFEACLDAISAAASDDCASFDDPNSPPSACSDVILTLSH